MHCLYYLCHSRCKTFCPTAKNSTFVKKLTAMKKIFGLAIALMLLAGCDDGDMTFKTFDFTDVDVSRCSDNDDILYKRNGTEVLILDIDTQTALLNEVTPDDEPRIVYVGGSSSNRIIYRNYDGDVQSTTLCSDIPPVNPSVIEEWEGNGVLEITTDEIRNDDDEITGYTHQITLRSVAFTKEGSDEEVIITDNNFGSVSSNLDFTFDFESTDTDPVILQSCDEDGGTGPFYSLNGVEALVLMLEDEFINITDTTTPAEIDLGDGGDDNDLILRIFSGTVSYGSICSLTPPITPTENQRWTATEGAVKIVTTAVDGGYKHTIHLIDAVFSRNGVTYEVPDNDYVIGSFTN